MPDGILVEVRLQPAVQERAAAVLETLGLTVAEAVALMLERTAQDGVLPFSVDPQHDAWFRAKVEEGLNDARPPLSHEAVGAHFAALRARIGGT